MFMICVVTSFRISRWFWMTSPHIHDVITYWVWKLPGLSAFRQPVCPTIFTLHKLFVVHFCNRNQPYPVCSESCFYTLGRIDWVEWRLARGEDGRGWSTSGPQEISHFSWNMSAALDQQSIWMKNHYMATVNLFEILICFTFLNSGHL